MVSSLILLRSLRVYILKQLFFSISVNSGFRNIYLATSWPVNILPLFTSISKNNCYMYFQSNKLKGSTEVETGDNNLFFRPFITRINCSFTSLGNLRKFSSLVSFYLARWFIVHNSFVNFVREMFSKNNTGPMPPPIMLLSDGGHVENLALLPLLKKRLKRIIVVDGG